MSLAFSNYSMHTGQRYDHDWYDWCVFASGDEAELQRVRAIEYTLHPSFPDPVRMVSDREHRFAIMSNGWGSFRIHIRILYDDGQDEVTAHWVRLDADWPRGTSASLADPLESSIYAVLIEGKYRWRSLDAIEKRTGLTREAITTTLHYLENRDLVRESPFRTIDRKELWGATAVVGIAPKLTITG